MRVRVTNADERPRRWNIEPYGDDMLVLPTDSLTVEARDGPEIVIEIGLHPDRVGEVLWIYVDGEPAAPSDLKLNDRSVWSPQ